MNYETPDLFKTPKPDNGSPGAITGSKPQLVFQLEIPGRLPSWNEILGMEHWARYKFKDEIQGAFLCALRATANDCSTMTTSARSTMLTACATLDSYRAMRREQRRLKSAKKKSSPGRRKGSASKSSKFEPVGPPPF